MSWATVNAVNASLSVVRLGKLSRLLDLDRGRENGVRR